MSVAVRKLDDIPAFLSSGGYAAVQGLRSLKLVSSEGPAVLDATASSTSASNPPNLVYNYIARRDNASICIDESAIIEVVAEEVDKDKSVTPTVAQATHIVATEEGYSNMPVLTGYINAAMSEAIYKDLGDGTIFGEIPCCPGVWADGDNTRDCAAELRESLELWLLIKLRNNENIPDIKGATTELVVADDWQ